MKLRLLLLLLALAGLPGCGPQPSLPVLKRPRPGERILIVAPHVDDETIAAAGYASDALGVGAEVFVVYLTAGDGGRLVAEIEDRTPRPRSRDFLREGRLRIREAHAAMALLGVPSANQFVLGYPDGDLLRIVENPESVIASRATRDKSVPYSIAVSPGAPYQLASLKADLARVFAAVSPDLVIAPAAFDAHPDHRAGALLVHQLLSSRPNPPPSLDYLVHARGFPEPFLLAPRAPLLPPRRFVRLAWSAYPLSQATLRRKQAVLSAYRSQRSDPYLRLLLDSFVRRNELFLETP